MLWGGSPKELVQSSKGHQKSSEEGLGFNWQVKAVMCFHEKCPSKVSVIGMLNLASSNRRNTPKRSENMAHG